MNKRIRINGVLYEMVRESKGMNEALDWDMFSDREKDEIRDGLMNYIVDIENSMVDEDLDSAKSFMKSVRMEITDWEIDFGYETASLDAEVDDEYYGEIDSLDDIPDGKSDGLYVGEGMLEIWKKQLPKIKKAAKRYIDYVGDRDYDDLYGDSKCYDLQEELLDALEEAKEALVNAAVSDIESELEWIGSDKWFDEEISSGNDYVTDWIDDYLLDKEDSDYADNESVRIVREESSKNKAKKGPRKFYVGEVIDNRDHRGKGLCYEVVARTQRTVTFHVTGDDRKYNGPDGQVDDELKCKINYNKVNRDESAFVYYGMVAYA